MQFLKFFIVLLLAFISLAHFTFISFYLDLGSELLTENALLVAWVLVIIWVIFPLFHSNAGRVVVVAGLCLLFFMLMPAELKRETVSLSLVLLHYFVPGEQLPNSLTLSKYGHFALYFFFSLLSLLLFKDKPFKILLILLSLAALSELWQLFVINRSPLVVDFYINASGVVVAWVCWLVVKSLCFLKNRCFLF